MPNKTMETKFSFKNNAFLVFVINNSVYEIGSFEQVIQSCKEYTRYKHDCFQTNDEDHYSNV